MCPVLSICSFKPAFILNWIFPSEPVSIVSTLVSPSIILSAFSPEIWLSTYVLTAFCVGTFVLLFCPNVPSVENSFTEAPIKPPTDPNLNDSRPDKLNADASNVTFPVAWSTLNWLPT